jgi:hypothetical protein
MVSRRSTAAARPIQPRAAPVMMTVTPRPEPPVVTTSSPYSGRTLLRSRASPHGGWAKSQKIAKGLTLHEVEQGIAVEVDRARGRRPAFLGCARAHLARFGFGPRPHASPPRRRFLVVADVRHSLHEPARS